MCVCVLMRVSYISPSAEIASTWFFDSDFPVHFYQFV